MKKSNNKVIFTGLFAAIASSSCCIAPMISLLAGFSGISSSLSWVEPFRYYLIILAIASIGYSWYAYFKADSEDECECEIEKSKFYQTKGFLIGMTIFAFLSILFPYYTAIFYPDDKVNSEIHNVVSLNKDTIKIEGMTCIGCQQQVNSTINKLQGIFSVKTSYDLGNVIVEFDEEQTTYDDVINAINSTGYKAIKK